MGNDLQSRVERLELYFKVAVGVVAILVLGGAVGGKLIAAAREEVTSLRKQVEELRPLADEVDAAGEVVREELDKSISEMDDVKTDLLTEVEAKARQSVRDASSQILQMHTDSWGGLYEHGSEKKWSSLPTDMSLELETSPATTQLYIAAHISRVQHSHENVNTEYRIVLDGNEVARTNTGGHYGWQYHALSFHSVAPVTAGSHTVRVQYRTQRGTERWYHDANGEQSRRLSVIGFRG